jgi:hypothetical protein
MWGRGRVLARDQDVGRTKRIEIDLLGLALLTEEGDGLIHATYRCG